MTDTSRAAGPRQHRTLRARITLMVALVVAAIGSSPSVVNAVDNIYFDGWANDQIYKSSSLQSYLTGGRSGITSALTRLTLRTVKSTGVVWHSVEGAVGSEVDFTHQRLNNARSQCKFRYSVSDLHGETRLICKYRR